VKTLARAYLTGFGATLGVLGALVAGGFVVGRIGEAYLGRMADSYLKKMTGKDPGDAPGWTARWVAGGMHTCSIGVPDTGHPMSTDVAHCQACQKAADRP
jgi:hypothetical protein